MILKSKAAIPAQAGTLGMTALEQQSHRKNNTIKRIFRQQIKRIIVLLAVPMVPPVFIFYSKGNPSGGSSWNPNDACQTNPHCFPGLSRCH